MDVNKVNKSLQNIKAAIDMGLKGGVYTSLDVVNQITLDLQTIVKAFEEANKQIETLNMRLTNAHNTIPLLNNNE